MSARECSGVLFDLFDTLVVFDRNRLPEIQVDGRVIRSTAGHLHETLRSFAPAVELPAFVEALLWSWKEAERVRDATHREVTAPERFEWLLGRLGVAAGTLRPDALPALLATHKRELSKAAVFPAHHGPLLRELGRRYPLAVVSNFDYAPTARWILEREGVSGLFQTVVVSDEVGWRKPKPVIFETALRRLGVPAERAVFVGDRADIDVAGAQAVGMRGVWLNRDRAGWPGGMAPPDFEIRDLGELLPILGIGRGPDRV